MSIGMITIPFCFIILNCHIIWGVYIKYVCVLAKLDWDANNHTSGDGDQLQKAMEVLSEMKGFGLHPNSITYSILLVASEKWVF